jgi:uncharacterized protein YgiM (DUF1202 family)
MEKGVWCRWQLLLGAVLAVVCLSCQPSVAPLPRQAPPPPPPARPETPPQHPSLYVKVGRLNLRAGPGMDFPKLGSLERNEEVEKLGEAENWYQVRVKRDGTLGWVSSEYLSSTPVTSPIETPVPETPPAPAVKEKPAPPPPPPAAEPKKPKSTKLESPAPREPKPAEAAEPPPRRAKPKPVVEEEEEETPVRAPRAVPEKPAPKKEEPPPAPPPPEEKPSGIRIM